LAGNGDGTFQTPVAYNVGTGPSAVVVADLNGDGLLDVATANTGGNSVSVLLANPGGTLASAVDYAAGAAPVALAAADLRGDGEVDLIVADSGANSVVWLLNHSDGTFEDASNPSPPTTGATRTPTTVRAT
jgi:hypothetical protein